MNTHVNFETAKLLKQKGFNLYYVWSYWEDELTPRTPGYALENGTTSQDNYWDFERYYAPTIAEVVMWLYEKHGVWIMVKRVDYKTLVRWDIYVNNNYIQQNLMGYNSITEAYEAAILYTLNKLI